MLTQGIHSTEIWLLTPEGTQMISQGSPEYLVWQAVAGSGMSIKDLQVSARAITYLSGSLLSGFLTGQAGSRHDKGWTGKRIQEEVDLETGRYLCARRTLQ